VTSPKALGEVLVTKNYDFIKPPDVREGIVRILGNGVLIAEGDEHKVQRKNLMPAFAFRHVKDLYSTFWEKSRETVVAMTKAVKSEEQKQTSATNEKEITSEVAVIEVGNWASRATLDIIGIAGLGKDFGAIKDPDSVLNRTYRTIFKPSPEARLLGLLNFFLPEWFVSRLPIKRNGEIEAAVKVVRSVCKDVISQKKEDLDQNTLDSVDILSVAMQSGGFTDEELVDQMLTFLAAGHETTSSAMTWVSQIPSTLWFDMKTCWFLTPLKAIYLLSKYPDIQARLREEVRANLPSPEQDITVDSQKIDHMSYLNAVCNEVLRCFPPVPGTVRNAAKDTTILGHHIPKGTRIMIMPWAVHKNEEFWGPEPGVFNPERWIPSEKNPHSANGGTPNNYSFVTFLHGPRSCIVSLCFYPILFIPSQWF
jgi:cytochrome P450